MKPSWVVPRLWPGETCAILASGPSMTREQADAVRGRCRVIAINNTGIDTQDSKTKEWLPALAPWADVLYASDAKWWHAYQSRALAFAGLKVTLKPNPFPEVLRVTQSPKAVFDPDPRYLSGGGNSGYAALHLAVHFGVSRVILLGFDMRDGAGKRRHYFGDHPARLNARAPYATWRNAFRSLSTVLEKRGVVVINATPNSALLCFKKMTLKEALRGTESRPIATPRDLATTGTPAGPADGRHPAGLVDGTDERASGDRAVAGEGLLRSTGDSVGSDHAHYGALATGLLSDAEDPARGARRDEDLQPDAAIAGQ